MATQNIVRVMFEAVMNNFTNSINNSLNHAENRFSNFSNKISNIFKIALTGAIAKVTFDQLFKNPLKVAADFEAQMSKVKAISGATDEDIAKLTKTAEEMGATTKFTATESAQAYEFMASKGWKAKQMTEGLPGLINLSAAADMDLAEATAILTGSLASFELEAGEADKIASAFAYTASTSGANIPSMGESMQYVGLSAKNMGIDIRTTMAMLGKLGDLELLGSSAGTALNAMFTDMRKKAKNGALEVGKTFVKIVDNTGSYRNIIDIITDIEKATKGMTNAQRAAALSFLDVRGLKAMNGLLTAGSDSLRQFTQKIKGAEDAAIKMANIKLDNLQGDITILQSAFQGLQKQVGDKILPHVRTGVQSLTQALNELSANGSIDKIANSIGSITAAAFEELAVVISNLPKIINSIASGLEWLAQNFTMLIELVKMAVTAWIAYKSAMLVITLVTNPVIAIIGAVIAALIYLYTECETFRRIVAIGFNAVKLEVLIFARFWITKFNLMAQAIAFLTSWIPGIGDATKTAVDFTKSLLNELDNSIGKTVNKIGDLISGVNEASNSVNSLNEQEHKFTPLPRDTRAEYGIDESNENTFDKNLLDENIGSSDYNSFSDSSSKKDNRTAFEKAKDEIDKNFEAKEDLINSQIKLAEFYSDKESKEKYKNELAATLTEKLSSYKSIRGKAKDNEKQILEAAINDLKLEIADIDSGGTRVDNLKTKVDEQYENQEDLVNSQIEYAEARKDDKAKKGYQHMLISILNDKLDSYKALDELVTQDYEKTALEIAKNRLLTQIANTINDIKEASDKLVGEFNLPSEVSTLSKYTYDTKNNSSFTRIASNPVYNLYLNVKDISAQSATDLRNRLDAFTNTFMNKNTIVSDGIIDAVRN